MSTPSPSRDGADRCPGLLAPFVSADGAMVRLRFPGGRIEASTLGEISSLATRFGDPDITLTSRGSVQLRGLPDPLPRELVAAVDALGLVPSGAHDRARNIVADPAGVLDDLVAELDAGLLADPDLAGLPGRFLMAVAEPDGPVLAEPWDVAIVDEGGSARVVVDSKGVVVARADAVGCALDAARRFLARRTDERTWNVRDLPAADRADLLPGGTPFAPAPGGPPAPGVHGDDLVALVPLGVLTPEMAEVLSGLRGSSQSSSHLSRRASVAEVRGRPRPSLETTLRTTPWRSVVVPGGAAHADDLAAAGFATSADSPWTVLTACAGAPSCGRTTTRTRRIAREAAPFVDIDGPPVHVIGCDRSCGHPARPHNISLNPSTAADIVAAQRSPRPEKDR
ncbi:cobalamin biosynthesis protein CobG [Janibacter sp. DB-40]|uniref:cobalamin biosynthesis protein CobG n=1 Tax=Janibacter sp. DB-40 TaxID=3028808 RepID=UPI0024053555|nr:cobalamin biosynthesis protein CobG [Janibacter sp. DB-40]